MNPLKMTLLMSALGGLLAGSAACAGSAAWQDYARSAQLLGPSQVDDAAKALSGLPANPRQVTEALLSDLMALTPGSAAIAQAGGLIRAALPSLTASAGPGPTGISANLSAALQAIDCVLHGLVYRSGAAVAKGANAETEAVALLRSVRVDLEVYPKGSAPGFRSPDWLERELRLGLGPERYLAAVQTLGAAAGG